MLLLPGLGRGRDGGGGEGLFSPGKCGFSVENSLVSGWASPEGFAWGPQQNIDRLPAQDCPHLLPVLRHEPLDGPSNSYL